MVLLQCLRCSLCAAAFEHSQAAMRRTQWCCGDLLLAAGGLMPVCNARLPPASILCRSYATMYGHIADASRCPELCGAQAAGSTVE